MFGRATNTLGIGPQSSVPSDFLMANVHKSQMLCKLLSKHNVCMHSDLLFKYPKNVLYSRLQMLNSAYFTNAQQ